LTSTNKLAQLALTTREFRCNTDVEAGSYSLSTFSIPSSGFTYPQSRSTLRTGAMGNAATTETLFASDVANLKRYPLTSPFSHDPYGGCSAMPDVMGDHTAPRSHPDHHLHHHEQSTQAPTSQLLFRLARPSTPTRTVVAVTAPFDPVRAAKVATITPNHLRPQRGPHHALRRQHHWPLEPDLRLQSGRERVELEVLLRDKALRSRRHLLDWLRHRQEDLACDVRKQSLYGHWALVRLSLRCRC